MTTHLRDVGQFLADCFKLGFGIAVIVVSFAFYAKYIAYGHGLQPYQNEEVHAASAVEPVNVPETATPASACRETDE